MFLNINHVCTLAVVLVLSDFITLLHIWVHSEDLTEAEGKYGEGLDQKKHQKQKNKTPLDSAA